MRVGLFLCLLDLLVLGLFCFLSGKTNVMHLRPASKSEVTVLIPVHNSAKTLPKVLENAQKLEQVITVVNGSTDDSLKICKEASEKGNVTVIQVPQASKACALEAGLQAVRTPFVLLLDDDTQVEGNLKVGYHEEAVAYPVLPLHPNSLLEQLQTIEYSFSMKLAKPAAADCVYMASGACGLYPVEELRRLALSGRFCGEDLEMSLKWHQAHNMVFSNSCAALTRVPRSLKALVKQRLMSWNPGFLLKLPLILKTLVKKRKSWRFKLGWTYELFAFLTDGVKLWSLVSFPQVIPLLWLYYSLLSLVVIMRTGFSASQKLRLAVCYPPVCWVSNPFANSLLVLHIEIHLGGIQ